MKSKQNGKAVSKKLSEQYLDPVNRRYPLTYPAIFETLIAFNNGELYECCGGYYGWDRVDVYGRKLARKLTQIVNSSVHDEEYDDDGKPVSSSHQGEGETRTLYRFHDGQVVAVKSKSSSDDGMEWEYSQSNDDDVEVTYSGEEDLHEAEYPGKVVKALRNKKKMSRKEMASMMSMSAARLGEIEDGDDLDDDEISEIASALGMTKKKLQKMIAIPPAETKTSGSEEMVEIIDDTAMEIEVIDDDAEIAVETDDIIAKEENKTPAAPAVFESVGLYEIDGKQRESHRLAGTIIIEEVRNDGTVRFTVPIINIGKYTANGNRYSKQCAEELIADINKLRESQREHPLHKRSSLDIRLSPQVKESISNLNPGQALEAFDMMPTHGPRISAAYGNPLLSKAGKIVGGYINESIAYIVGETLRTQAGKDISVLIEEEMLKGISLVGIPKVFESNGKGPDKKGLDVDRLQFLGGDFTDNPAMPFPEFADQESYFELVK